MYTHIVFFSTRLVYLLIVTLFASWFLVLFWQNHRTVHILVKVFHCWSSQGLTSTDDQNSDKYLLLDLAFMWQIWDISKKRVKTMWCMYELLISNQIQVKCSICCFGFHRSATFSLLWTSLLDQDVLNGITVEMELLVEVIYLLMTLSKAFSLSILHQVV